MVNFVLRVFYVFFYGCFTAVSQLLCFMAVYWMFHEYFKGVSRQLESVPENIFEVFYGYFRVSQGLFMGVSRAFQTRFEWFSKKEFQVLREQNQI